MQRRTGALYRTVITCSLFASTFVMHPVVSLTSAFFYRA